MSITVSAPGKLMLLGEHAVVYSYPCMASAIDKYLTVKIKKRIDNSDELLISPITDNSFVKKTLDIFKKKYSVNQGVDLEIQSELGNYGLGSSAAVVVAIVKGLAGLFKISLTNKELFDISFEVVVAVQKLASGFDIAASIWGGTIYFDGHTKQVEYLGSSKLPIIVCFSGSKAKTVEMVKKVKNLKEKNEVFVEDIFRSIKKLVEQGKRAIINKDWRELGNLYNENHRLLIKLGVSTDKLDTLVSAAVTAGAYGAKLSGAGGGDCMIAVVSDDRKVNVKAAIEQAGGKVLNISVGLGK